MHLQVLPILLDAVLVRLVRTSHCGRSLAGPSLLSSGIWGPLYRGGGLQIIESCKSQLGNPRFFCKLMIPIILSFIRHTIFTEIIYRIMIMRDNVKTRAAQLEKFEIVMKVKVYIHMISPKFSN